MAHHTRKCVMKCKQMLLVLELTIHLKSSLNQYSNTSISDLRSASERGA